MERETLPTPRDLPVAGNGSDMDVGALPRRHPIPAFTTALFLVALGATGAYYADLVPGVPRALPTFVDLLVVTVALLAIAATTWAVSLAVD